MATGAALELANTITVGAEPITSILGTGISNGGALRNISGTNTWGGLITLAGATQINSDAGELILDVAAGNAIAGTADNLTFGGAGNITIKDPINNTTASLAKIGTGILTLAASSTYSGVTSGSGGWIRATSSTNALGQGALSLGGGNLEIANDTGLALNRNTTLAASGTIRSDRLTSGAGVTHTLGTLGTLGIGVQTLTLETDATVTSGTAGLTFGAVTGTGAATFISNRSATANTLLTLGAITATNFGITVGGSGDTSITGIVGLGSGGLTKTGNGTLTLSAANTYTGTTRISAGTLSISATNNLGIASSAVLLGDALTEGTLSYTGTSVPFTRGFTIGAGGGQLDVTRSGTTLTVSGTGNITGTGLFTVGGLGNVTVSSTISGISGLTMAGSGTLTLSATNTFGGTTTVNSGVLRLGNASALSGSNAVTVAGGTLDNGGFSNSVASFTITGGVFSGTGTLTAGAYSLQGGTISANLGSGTLATLANTTLSGTSAASAVQLNAGTLTLSTANLLSAAPVVTGSTGATLALGGNQTVGSIAGGAGVSLGSNTLTTGTSNTSTTLSGDVSGSGNLVKVGSGTFTLSGNNSYSGTTSINAGAVSVGSVASGAVNQALGTGDTVNLGVAATSSGRLLYTGGAGTLSKNVFALGNGTDTIQNAGSGLLTLSGTLQKNGTILRLQGGAQGINVTGRITGTSQNSDLAVQNGLTTLSTTNSYNGPTFINSSGTLALGINNAIPSNSAVTIGGTFAGGNGGAGTLSMGAFTNAIGSLAFSGSGGTIRFAPTLSQTSTLMLTASGNVNLAGTSTLDLGNTVLTAGLYRLIAGSSLTGQFSGTTGLDSNYFVRYGTVNANEVDLQRKADQAATFTMTAANTRALVNTSVAASGTLTNITPSGGTNLAVSLSSGGPLTANGFSSGTNSLAPGASTAVSGSIQAGATAGTFGWSVLNTDPNAIQTTSTATGSLTVVNQRTFSTSTGTLSLGFVHQGGSFSTPTLTVTSTGLNSVTENATLGGFTGGAAGFSLGRTSGTNVFDGLVSPQQAVYTLSGSTGSLGAISGTYSSTVTREFSGSTSINVAVSGQVYSGQSIWATTTSGTLGWGTLSGTGANAFGLNWGTNQGSPGLDAGFTTTDTATFASALTSGTAVILLNGAAPSLRGITFSNSAGTYDLDVGSGGTGRITLAAGGTSAASINTLAGFHEIHTELQLGSNLQVAVTGGSGLILHAAISGSNFSLTKADAGLLTVRGNNAYSGGTLIAGGTLALGNSGTPLGSGSVVLTNNSTLDMRGFAIGNTIDATYGFIINPGAANIDITGTATVSGTGGIIGVYTVQPTAVATFTSPLGVLSGSTVAGTITVQGGGTLLTTSTITSNGSILVNTGAVATLTGPVDGTVTTAGATTFSGVVLGAADITVSGGTTTFHGTTFGDVNVDVSGTNTGNATAIFSGTVAKTAHVYASGTITLLGAVAASADVKAETGGVVQLLGTGSFAQPAMTNNGLVVVNRSDYLRMATAISGSGALEKYGSGTLELAGANTFTGQVSANAGRLLVNGNLAAPVYVAPAATLGGSGAIGGFTSIAGIHAPGNSPGLQTFTGGLTYGGTSTFQWELAANTADAADRGVLYDGVNVTDSNLQIDAGATIDLIFSGGLSSVSWADSFWDTNHQWVAIAHAGMGLSTGLFTIGTIGNDINGNPIWVARPDAYFSVLRQGDNIVVAFSAPEPGAITIAAIGLGIVAWRLRRRSRPTPPGDAGSTPPPRSE